MRPNPVFSLAALLFLGTWIAGCDRSRSVRVVSAEFQDETPDGVALQRETLRLVLSQPLPPGLLIDSVKVRVAPPFEWDYEVLRGTSPRELVVRVTTGRPAFRFQGVHGIDPEATGVGIDLGTGVTEWTDVSIAVSLPVLRRVIWMDQYPPEGNLTVDQGDALRLVFDRPVKLAAGSEERAIHVPRDILLTKPNSDRLSNGEFPARLEPGVDDREVLLVLGSRPFLNVAGVLPTATSTIERFDSSAPSGLALNGTELLPFPGIVDARGGPGAISLGEADIEFPESYRAAEPRPDQALPTPGSRLFHTLTPISRQRAVLAGGAAADTRVATAQVLMHDPAAADADPARAFRLASSPLPHPTHSHTATLLAGPDLAFGTFDDVVIIVGGTDGSRSLDAITVLFPREDGRIDVEPLADSLTVARAEHAATAVGPNEILIDGGRKSDPNGPGGLVDCAEHLILEYSKDGKPRVVHHRVFGTLGRSLHTLTLLPPASDGSVHVLAVGGQGGARQQGSQIRDLGKDLGGAGSLSSASRVAVLATPLLLNVSQPERSFELRVDALYSLVRWGHTAVPVEVELATDSPPRSNLVLIAGGAIRHPVLGREQNRELWEVARNEPWPQKNSPQGHEAAAAVLFRFDPAAVAESRFEVLPYATPDAGRTPDRIHFAVATTPDQGLIWCGGELRDGVGLSSIEAFIPYEQRICELAVPLAAPRSRHQAYVVQRGGRTSLFLVGGIPGDGYTGAFSDVEEVPLR